MEITIIVSSAAILEHCVLIMQKVNLKEKARCDMFCQCITITIIYYIIVIMELFK